MTSAWTVVWTENAEHHLEEAIAWWNEHRHAATELLRNELIQTLNLLSSAPHLGVLVRQRRTQQVRRVVVPRVRYHLYYRVDKTAQCIVVLAFWHTSRGERPIL